MKSVFLIFLSLLCLAGCAPAATDAGQSAPTATIQAGASSAPAESTADTAPAEKQAETVTVEIVPPEGWTPVEGSVLDVQYLKGTASFMVKPEPFAGATLDEVVKEAAAIYQKSFGSYAAEGEAKPLTVDGKDARKLTFTCTVSNIQMKFTYVYLFAGDQTYVITFGDQEGAFDALSADIGTILNDIRFTVG